MAKKATKKSTILTLRIATAVLLSLVIVLTGVGIYFAINRKSPNEPEAIVNPLDFATDTWDGETEDNSSFLSGEQLGNRGEHVYTINSASSFVYFVNLVNDEDRAREYNYFRDYTIYLNSNIDLAGYSIQSIGKQVTDGGITTSTFQGTFNGAYYSIMNANIVGNGLFGYVENATIENVGLYNATIDSTETYTGSIAGIAINTNISNTYVRLGSTKGSMVGGIVGAYISTNGTHEITNSFVDNTIIGDRVGSLIGYLDTNHTRENAVTISNTYYTSNIEAINTFAYVDNSQGTDTNNIENSTSSYENNLQSNFVSLDKVIYATDISQFSTWNYTSEYNSTSDWCDYAYRENSTQLDFRFPVQTGFVKVFLNGSYIENTVTINGTTTDSSTLAESFNQVNANDTAEVHIIVEKVYVEEEAVAKANATLTVTPDVTTTLVRSEGNSENLIVGSSNSQLYIGEEEPQATASTITLDGNIDYVKSNNQQSGALIYAQGEDLVVGSNVILQNNINNTTGYGGGLSVYNINNDYDPVTNTADTIVISPTVTNCEATYGGGMSIIGSTVDINNANVTNCTAENGGAVAIIDNASLENEDRTTLVSTYLNYGGNPATPLRTVISSSRTINGGTYSRNSVSTDGGAFYVSLSSAGTVNFNTVYVLNNSANNGGGIYITYSGTDTKTVNFTYPSSTSSISGQMNSNTARYAGGGIYASGSARSDVYSNILNFSGQLENNRTTSTTGYGGGIYSCNVCLDIRHQSTVQGNSAYYGGGVYFASGELNVGLGTGDIVDFYSNSATYGNNLSIRHIGRNVNGQTGNDVKIYGRLGRDSATDARNFGINCTKSSYSFTYVDIYYRSSGYSQSGYTFKGFATSSTATTATWTSGTKSYNNVSGTVEVWYPVYWTYRIDININNPSGEQDYNSGTMSVYYSWNGTTYSNLDDQPTASDTVRPGSYIRISNIVPADGYILDSVTVSTGTITDNGDGTYTYTVNLTSTPVGTSSFDSTIYINMRNAQQVNVSLGGTNHVTYPYSFGYYQTTVSSTQTVENNERVATMTITNANNNYSSGPYLRMTSRLVANQQYVWTADIRASRNITLYSVGHEQGGLRSASITTSWQTFTYTFTANSNGSSSFIFYTSVWQNGDILYAKNVSVQLVTDQSADTALPSLTVTEGSSYGTLPTPERDGYEFLGWNVAPDYGPNGADNYGVTNVETYVRRVFPLSWWTNSTFQVGQSIYIDVSWNTGTLNQVDVNDLVLTSDQYIVSGNRCYMYYDITSSKNINSYSFVDFSFSSSSTTLTVNYFVIYTPSTDYVTSSTVAISNNHFLMPRWSNLHTNVTFNANGGTISSGETSKYVISSDTYGGMNLYDPSNVTSTTSGLTKSSSGQFSLNVTLSPGSSGSYYFRMPYEELGFFQPDTTYTAVLTCVSKATHNGIAMSIYLDDGTGISLSPISFSLYGVISNQNFITTFTTKSSFDNLDYLFNSYASASVPSGYYNCTFDPVFRISIFYGDRTDELTNYSYVSYGSTPSNFSLPTPTRSGYTFAGWYTATSGGTQVTSSTIVTNSSDQTLYARWNTAKCTVTFNANGGSVGITSKTVTYGSTYGTLPTPTRSGYEFDGWYTSSTGGSLVTSSTTVTQTSNHTLYARWTEIVYYTVNKNVNGSTSSSSVRGNSLYDPGDVANQSDFLLFNGWETSNTTSARVYTDLIYSYYGGANLGVLPSQTNLTSGSISVRAGATSNNFTYIMSFDFTGVGSGCTLASMRNGSTTKWNITWSGNLYVVMGSSIYCTTSVPSSGKMVIAITYNGSTRELKLYVNGELGNTAVVSSANAYSYSSSDMLNITNSSASPNTVKHNNSFFIPSVVDVSGIGSAYAAKETTGNFLVLVNGDATLTSSYYSDVKPEIHEYTTRVGAYGNTMIEVFAYITDEFGVDSVTLEGSADFYNAPRFDGVATSCNITIDGQFYNWRGYVQVANLEFVDSYYTYDDLGYWLGSGDYSIRITATNIYGGETSKSLHDKLTMLQLHANGGMLNLNNVANNLVDNMYYDNTSFEYVSTDSESSGFSSMVTLPDGSALYKGVNGYYPYLQIATIYPYYDLYDSYDYWEFNNRVISGTISFLNYSGMSYGSEFLLYLYNNYDGEYYVIDYEFVEDIGGYSNTFRFSINLEYFGDILYSEMQPLELVMENIGYQGDIRVSIDNQFKENLTIMYNSVLSYYGYRLPIPTRPGYRFVGWEARRYSSSLFNNQYDSCLFTDEYGYIIEDNGGFGHGVIGLYAMWEPYDQLQIGVYTYDDYGNPEVEYEEIDLMAEFGVDNSFYIGTTNETWFEILNVINWESYMDNNPVGTTTNEYFNYLADMSMNGYWDEIQQLMPKGYFEDLYPIYSSGNSEPFVDMQSDYLQPFSLIFNREGSTLLYEDLIFIQDHSPDYGENEFLKFYVTDFVHPQTNENYGYSLVLEVQDPVYGDARYAVISLVNSEPDPITGETLSLNGLVNIGFAWTGGGFTISIQDAYGYYVEKTLYYSSSWIVNNWSNYGLYFGDCNGDGYSDVIDSSTSAVLFSRDLVSPAWFMPGEPLNQDAMEFYKITNPFILVPYTLNTYSIELDLNGGTISSGSGYYNATYGTPVEIPIPTRLGYTFDGWEIASSSDYSYAQYQDDSGSWVDMSGGVSPSSASIFRNLTTETDTVTLEARWVGNSVTVTFDYGDGSGSTASKSVSVGGTYGTLPTPTAPSGYAFDGWFTASTGGSKVTSSTRVTATSNHTLYARYVNSYVSFDDDTLKNGIINTAYTDSFTPATGTGTITYSITKVTCNGSNVTVSSGKYNGLSLSGTTISGTPTVAGTYIFTITATNGIVSDSAQITIVIGKATNPVEVNGYSNTYDGEAHALVYTVNKPSGTTIYYAVGTQLTSSNYSSTGSTTIPTRTNAGTYVVYWYSPETSVYLAKSGSVTVTISKYKITIDMSGSLVYNATVQTGIKEGTGYTRSGVYEATNAGTYEAIVSLVNTTNYIWSDNTTAPKTISWSIAKRPLSECTISLSTSGYDISGSSYKYEAGEIRPGVTVKIGNNTVPASNYSVTYSNNVNVGTATVTITATDGGNLSGNTSKTFTIAKRPLSECDISLSTSGYDMSGSAYKYQVTAITPSVTVKIKNNIVPSEQYTVSYSNNVNAGTATVTVTATDNGYLLGNTLKNFTIAKRPLSECSITLSTTGYDMSGDSYKYQVTAITPSVTVKIGNNTVPASNYTVSYSNNINAGTATVTVTATSSGNLLNNKSQNFTIAKRPLSECSITLSTTGYDMSGSSYKYQVTAITPGVTVKIGENTVPASNYTVSYSNNINAGTATVTVTATSSGNLLNNKSQDFTIAKRPLSECSITLSTTGYDMSGSSYKYQVTAITPGVTVKIKNNTIPSENYRVSYSNNINVGTATAIVTATASGNLLNSKSQDFTIAKRPLSECSISLSSSGYDMSGDSYKYQVTAITPTVIVKIGNNTVPIENYTATYSNNINVGTATVAIKATDSGNLSGSASMTFTIVKRPLSECNISLSTSGYDMSGSAYKYEAGEIRPGVTVKIGNNTVPASNYTVAYSNNINVGTATVTITATDGGNLSGSESRTFTIVKRPLSECDISLSTSGYDMSGSSYKYEAGEICPGVTVKIGNNTVPASNYTVAYSNNINVGTATVTITATDSGNLSGSESRTFTIVKRPLSECSISLSSSGYDISGSAYKYEAGEIRPVVTVRIRNNTVPSVNYSVSYSNNINVGTATVTVTATDGGNLSGSTSANFSIVKRPLSECNISLSSSGYDMSGDSYKYIAGTIQPAVVVRINNNIVPESNYTVTYSNNVNVGTATVTITATDGGNLSGSASRTFTIVKRPLSECDISLSSSGYDISGSAYKYQVTAITPTVIVKIGNNTVPASNYTVTYSNNVNAGTANISITATTNGNLSGNRSVSFTIAKRPVGECSVTISQTSFIFTGQEIRPDVTVRIHGNVVPESNYTVEYSNNINVGKGSLWIVATPTGNLINGTGGGGNVIEFEIETREYNIIIQENGGSETEDMVYSVSATNQAITLPTLTFGNCTFEGYTIVTNTLGGTSSITNNTTLNIPANAYGDITVKANWSVEVTIEIVGNKSENTLTISDGKNNLTTGKNAVAEGSNITINTTLTANADASEYQLFSIYKDNELVITTSSLLDTEYTTTLNEAITTACTIRLEYKEGKRIVVNTDQGVTSEIDISGTSDGDVYATDADNTITITIDTSSLTTSNETYIGFTYEINGETHSSYNTGDGVVRPAGNTENEYTYTITGTDGITSIDVIIRQAQSVVLNTNVAGYNSLSLTSEDGFTRQLDRTTTSYLLYVGEWEINVDLAEGANITEVLDNVFGVGNYTVENGRYYYTITAA